MTDRGIHSARATCVRVSLFIEEKKERVREKVLISPDGGKRLAALPGIHSFTTNSGKIIKLGIDTRQS